MKKIPLCILTVFLWAYPLVVTAMAGGGAPEERAIAALEALRKSYVSEDRERFFHAVSDEAYFSVTDLKIRTAEFFRDYGQIELDFFVNETLPGSGKALIRLRWEKRAVDRSGSLKRFEGRTDLIFKIADEKTAGLLDLQGDSPF